MSVRRRNGSGPASVHRMAWFLRLVGWLCVASFFVIGLSMVAGFFADAKGVGGVSGLIVGVFCIAASVWLGWVVGVNRLVASADGLAFFDVFRRRRVPWEAVAGFGTSRSDGMVGWPAVVVRLHESGGREVKQVIGTRRRAERAAAELEETLRRCRQAQPAGPGTGGDGRDQPAASGQ